MRAQECALASFLSMTTNSPIEIAGTRAATAEDATFLFRLFADDRIPEFVAAGIAAQEAEKIIELQYRGQQMSYAAQYPRAENLIVLDEEGRAAGRLLLSADAARWRIVDIAVTAAYRGKGIATRAIEICQARCRSAHARLELRVDVVNPARRLYERLGFRAASRATGQDVFSVEMVWAENALGR